MRATAGTASMSSQSLFSAVTDCPCNRHLTGLWIRKVQFQIDCKLVKKISRFSTKFWRFQKFEEILTGAVCYTSNGDM